MPPGAPVIVALTVTEGHVSELQEAGFSAELEIGETVLPKPAGKVSEYNAEGTHIVHRDRPMETAYRQMEWTWEQWSGPYTETQARIVDVPYKRYPRTFVEPPSVELTVAEVPGREKVVVSEPVPYDDEHVDALLHRVNLFRELFGEAALLTEELEPFTRTEVRRLNWEILPPGELPWERLQRRLRPILDRMGERTGPAVEHRLRLLTEEREPDFTAVGRAGFHGYIIFGYESTGLYVVESLHYGNATYVLGQDWARLSQMTKAEILRADLQEDRIIHREGWDGRVRGLLR